MGNNNRDKTISKYLCELLDKELEKEYLNHEINGAIKYIKPAVLLLGLLFFLFIIPDFFVIKSRVKFNIILADRVVFLVLIIILYTVIRQMKNYVLLPYWLTVNEIIASLLFLQVFCQYESPTFFIQAFGVMIIILSVFLIPNRWIFMTGVSVFIAAGFFIISVHYVKGIKLSEYSAVAVYLLLVVVLSSISSYRVNYYKRKQFIDGKELIRLSITDSLTGVYNRLKIDNELQKWISYSKRYKTKLSIIMFDFDDFKGVNDNYGHMIGDEVIVETVGIVKRNIREPDLFARWGGEEFIILLPNTEKANAVEMAQRLKFDISDNEFYNTIHMTCSFGVTALYENDSAETLIHRVDGLLYRAKAEGKDKVICD